MRSSARRTDRRRGFSLLEVIIAASLFSVVMLIALSQIKESGDAAKISTVQADLRKQGEKCLNEIVRDLSTALAPYSGAGLLAGGTYHQIQFCKTTGYDTSNKVATLAADFRATSSVNGPGVAAGSTPRAGNPIANTATFIFSYSQPQSGVNKNNLVFSYGSKASWAANAQTTVIAASELANPGDNQPQVGTPVDGFTVSWTTGQSSMTLLTAGTPVSFLDQPTALTIKLVLKRRIGGATAVGVSEGFAWTTVQTIVMLRADENY